MGNITCKHIKANVCKNDGIRACNLLSFDLLIINNIMLLNGRQYAMPKMVVRSTQGQNWAVHSTQREGVSPAVLSYLNVRVAHASVH